MTEQRGKHKDINEETVALEFSMLTDESSPVEKNCIQFVCYEGQSWKVFEEELWLQHNEGQQFAKPVFWPWIRDKSWTKTTKIEP